jgi:hypothetical protein
MTEPIGRFGSIPPHIREYARESVSAILREAETASCSVCRVQVRRTSLFRDRCLDCQSHGEELFQSLYLAMLKTMLRVAVESGRGIVHEEASAELVRAARIHSESVLQALRGRE